MNRARRGIWVFLFSSSLFCGCSPTLVSHPCLYLSARLINHSFWRFASCGDSDSTVYGSCPHKWGQDVSCGYLIRRWQLILELLFHYSPIAVLLHLCFPLGCSGKLPLVACRFLLSWFRFAENKIVLGNVSWQFGLFSFVLRHLFLLGMGLGFDMKWVGVSRFFGPIIALQNPAVRLLGRRGGFWCPQALIMACQVLSSASARASLPAQGTLLTFRCTRRIVINTFYGETWIASICEARIHWCFYEAVRI